MALLDIFRRDGIRCPRDHARLASLARGGSEIERCGSCGGVWIDAKQLRRLANGQDLQKADQWAGNYPQKSGFACPRCGGDCCGTFLEDLSVHTCIACHGVWLDSQEVASARGRVSVESSARQGPELRAFLAKL